MNTTAQANPPLWWAAFQRDLTAPTQVRGYACPSDRRRVIVHYRKLSKSTGAWQLAEQEALQMMGA